MKIISLILILCSGFESFSQNYKEEEVVDSVYAKLSGTLLIPEKEKPTVVLIIAGSGPTDRNGNNSFMTNNSLKMLAEELAKNGIASLRYDKRGIGKSAVKSLNESELRFEDYINDAKAWIRWLKNSKRFGKIVVAGHSEGSLIGMVAAREEKAEGYVSLAGAGRPIEVVLMEQIRKNPYNTPAVVSQVDSLLSLLKNGKTFESVPSYLMSLFRPSIQPYMISWMKYEPAKEIAKLTCPVLIVQGNTDIQVALADSEELHKAKPSAQYKVVEGMNHIFKDAPADQAANAATYRNPDLPISQELIPTLVDFIKNTVK